MTSSKILLYFCLALIGGFFLNSLMTVSQPLQLGILISGTIIIFLFLRHKKMIVIGFCFLFLAIGIWRHQSFILGADNNEFLNYIIAEDSVILTGIVNKQPDTREKSVKLELQPENYEGKILITTGKYPQYQSPEACHLLFGDFELIHKLKRHCFQRLEFNFNSTFLQLFFWRNRFPLRGQRF